jgi:CheY-like chemotaxis protein
VEPAAGPGEPPLAVVTIRDVTADVQQQQKVAAIHQAGLELANLSPEDLTQMSVDSRIDLLKSNILHYTRQLLNFDVVEIRLLDAQTGRLEPLLSSGMTDEAAGRVLYAQPESNGVTGHVAYTGKSYLCEDTSRDPLYIEGVRGAKSSITVPLKLQDQTIGTFNVESPDAEGLTDLDLMFLEIFARDVAVALNTLELLVAERAATAAKNVEAIHGAVAMPVDEILNDAVHLMEAFIGKQPEMDERLRHILRNARDIKQLIQREGQKMAPVLAQPVGASGERRSLRGKLVLVVDSEESVRQAAHRLLERQGCTVETAHSGIEALAMIRQMTPGMSYDAVLADKRLPDMDGCELMRGVRVLRPETPLLLMTGFGYDPGHVLVRARELGLAGVLYKPFKTDKLLDTVEQAMAGPPTACPPTAN